ncbi:hypothetical protein GIY30_19320 [Gordonia sp. HNM0687]|uniref:ChsH2 C-terminal OB-fold domain-containing protein n=1 Tax=Gordonia mangrovi TaxID=2665643 RepID=A0A6L7GU00_9ACTN|nr:OB-fold domain-containing protein [Gordonia mangrovi]MXP23494.1 hypothetical protein [Gordonia mangrovi]UVF76612.1 OB-fold domain-containing protein [Gordonia mangrovi]
METTRTPVAEGLFTRADGEAQLIASRRLSDGSVSFPAAPEGDDVETILLSSTGTLFTWTTQQFPPPSPPYAGVVDKTSFEPYAVGYVEFPEGVLVEGRLTVRDPEQLTIGQEMTVVLVPFTVAGESPHEVETFAFAPAGARDEAGVDAAETGAR